MCPAAGVSAQQLGQMLQNMPQDQLAQIAQSVGMSPEQLQMVSLILFPRYISTVYYSAVFYACVCAFQFGQMMASGQVGLGGEGGGGDGGEGGADPPGVVRLTQEEADAVERLTNLGFNRQQALEAYLACDKNEEMAANLLFDHGLDDNTGEGGDNTNA